LTPGGSGLAQLRLAAMTLALPGDRFILRQFSPVVTIGGGTVLNIPAHGRRLRQPEAISFLELQERGVVDLQMLNSDDDGDSSVRAAALEAIICSSAEASTLADLVMRTGWAEEEIRRIVKNLADRRKVRVLAEEPLAAVSPDVVASCADRLLREVERFHAANPLTEAISKEDLRTRCAAALSADIFRVALQDAVSAGKLTLAGDSVKRAGRSIRLDPGEARARDQIEREFARGGLAAPGIEAVLAALPVEMAQAQKLLQLLLRERVLLKISSDVVLHHEAVDRLRGLLAEYKRTRGERLAVTEFKELAGVSRKYAIPLLEYLDRERVTRRVGDERVIL
jgi:selenocysteine-specific elongation factor